VTEPLPDPLPPVTTVNHGALLVAIQLQPLPEVTDEVAVPPAAGRDSLSGETVKVHAVPLWVTVTVCPATVSVPMRCDATVRALTLKVTVPLPDPFAPRVTVSQPELLLAAVQLQPA
jgi:hypothetical protein